MAHQGLGTSKNKASALMLTPSILNPPFTTSLQVEVTLHLPRFSKKFRVISALSLLNSNVQSMPKGPITSEKAQERDPLPVPASTTMWPGSTSNFNKIAELSIEYNIWVLRARVSVMSVDFGSKGNTCSVGLLNAGTLTPQGLPTKLMCLYAPSVVWNLSPARSWVSLIYLSDSQMIEQSLSFMVSPYCALTSLPSSSITCLDQAGFYPDYLSACTSILLINNKLR